MTPSRKDAIWAAAIGAASLLLYLRTMAPDVVDADGGELQFAAWNFAFVHPTGYPLFLILGGLVQHILPLGNPAFRLNMFTAATAALTVAVVFLVIHRTLHHRLPSLVGAATFAVTTTFWRDATAAEVYAPAALFLALLILLALKWQESPTAGWFGTFALVQGLALTHHRTILLWVPGFLLFFAIVAWHRRLTAANFGLIRAGLFCVLPLLLYLYIPIRAPSSPYAALALGPNRQIALFDSSPGGLFSYLLGRQFQQELTWDAISNTRLVALPALVIDEIGQFGSLLAIAGLLFLILKRSWPLVGLTVAGLGATVVFASAYHIGDIYHYYIPVYLVFAIWIGCALGELSRIGSRPDSSRMRVVCWGTMLVVIALLPLGLLITHFAAADRSEDTNARRAWTQILSEGIPENAILVSNDRDEMMPLWYMQYVENTRRDLLGLFPLISAAPEYANVTRLLENTLGTQRPVFLVKPMPGLEIKFQIEPFKGTLHKVVAIVSDDAPQFKSGAMIGDRVRVVGYDLMPSTSALQIVVYYQPMTTLGGDYTAFVQLMDQGRKVAQGNDHQMGGVFYPSSQWSVGETVRDEQTIPLTPSLRGLVHIVVGMYRYPDLEPLGEPVEIGTVDLR